MLSHIVSFILECIVHTSIVDELPMCWLLAYGGCRRWWYHGVGGRCRMFLAQRSPLSAVRRYVGRAAVSSLLFLDIVASVNVELDIDLASRPHQIIILLVMRTTLFFGFNCTFVCSVCCRAVR